MNSTIAPTQPRAAACPNDFRFYEPTNEPLRGTCHGLVWSDDYALAADIEALASLSRELPRMTPERLWFLTEDDKQVPAPKLAARMPNGDHAFAWHGLIYAMTEDEWMHYDCMRRAA